MIKHSLGPWAYHKNNNHGFYSVTNNEFMIADIKDNLILVWRQIFPDKGREENNINDELTCANARLISASPELLEACKKAMEFPASERDFDGIKILLKQAIAKAEGGQNVLPDRK